MLEVGVGSFCKDCSSVVGFINGRADSMDESVRKVPMMEEYLVVM
jgi:hypothetical protein